jgi:SAM-dependent methyltransferase
VELLDIVRRPPVADPWAEGEKIPWDDPAFSARMLAEHLSQEHDRASRRASMIDAHVDWIHRGVLAGRPARILDLGCGPGLYTARLAAHGHTCVGIDFAPAAVDYATRAAREAGLRCTYQLADMRDAAYGQGYGLVMLIFGELNVFRPADARAILTGARRALDDDGRLLLEVHTPAAVRAMGEAPAAWRAAEAGLFSARPHLRLDESFWDDERQVATQRYLIVDAETAAVTRYAQSVQAYSEDGYRVLLAECGFVVDGTYAALDGSMDGPGDFVTIVAVPSA